MVVESIRAEARGSLTPAVDRPSSILSPLSSAQVSLLSGGNKALYRALCSRIMPHHYHDGSNVFNAGEAALDVLIVVRGEVREHAPAAPEVPQKCGGTINHPHPGGRGLISGALRAGAPDGA